MENASKALLIAGGVLITILVATLGVYFARSMADQEEKIYQQLEESEITEFNEQFLRFENQTRFKKNEDEILTSYAYSINIQDVITLIHLAKDSNKKNQLTDDMAPDDIQNDTSLYVKVQFNATTFVPEDPTTGINVLEDNNGTIYSRENAEKFTEAILTNILNREVKKNILYSCEISTNKNTGYVNLITIEN